MKKISEKYPKLYNACRKYPEIELTNNPEQSAILYRDNTKEHLMKVINGMELKK